MKKEENVSLLSVVLFTVTLVAVAQQVGSNSPYGRYGYGLLSDPLLEHLKQWVASVTD